VITRAALVKISSASISIVLDCLLSLVEDLARPYKAVISHPPHVLLSELYILALISDCCCSHWRHVNTFPSQNGHADESTTWQRAELPASAALDEVLVSRVFEVIKVLFEPLPESYILPARTILDEGSSRNASIPAADESARPMPSPPADEPLESARLLRTHAVAIGDQVKTIVEYTTASSWTAAFEYFRSAIYSVRTAIPAQGAPIPNAAAAEDERSALIVLRLVSFFWVDGHKLSFVIQEFCASFLHFRKSFQNTVAVVCPMLITRWLDRYPAEFVALHTMGKRRDGGADTLFDMTQTAADNGRRRALLYPFQTTLLFLLPDVFEVASNLREAKGGNVTKKAVFLEGLRKSLRNKNEQAAYCLVSLLRAARHFDAESDSAFASYAMDVQHEVRDAVFRRPIPGSDGVFLEQDMMTAAFVSLAHLSFDSCVSSLTPVCLAPAAPLSFKISVIQACSHFARLNNSQVYQPLFVAVSSFIRSQLKVSF
jgi:neurofibromin 1